MWRNEKPGPGRFRQFTQFDADTVGTDNIAADAEICMLAADTLEALGIPRGEYVIKVNNRKVLDGVLESIGIDRWPSTTQPSGSPCCAPSTSSIGLGSDGVAMLLGKGRKDESGDFTPGAGLDAQGHRYGARASSSVAGSQGRQGRDRWHAIEPAEWSGVRDRPHS